MPYLGGSTRFDHHPSSRSRRRLEGVARRAPVVELLSLFLLLLAPLPCSEERMLRASDGDRIVWAFPIWDVDAGWMSDRSRDDTCQHISHFGLGNMIFFCLVFVILPLLLVTYLAMTAFIHALVSILNFKSRWSEVCRRRSHPIVCVSPRVARWKWAYSDCNPSMWM